VFSPSLCALVGSEPLIVVNAGLGSALEAASLVAYVNGHGGLATIDAEESTQGKSFAGGKKRRQERRRAQRQELTEERVEEAMVEEPRRRMRNGEPLPFGCQW
jgi:hypothetical protein